jgi:chromatin remodeling complex protein RSC6
MPAKKTTTKKTSAPKSASKSKKVKETPVVEDTPVVETPVVETPVVETPVTSENSYDNEFSDIHERLRSAQLLIKELSGIVTRLEKRVSRDRKVMDKKMKGKVKKPVDPNKPPSGFAKPGPVSDELRSFLSLGKDELIARTEVTKRITAYCKEHKLQKESDKRTIQVNEPLRKLLRLNKNDELTFFNLQKYMKVHYPNKEGVYTGL